MHEDPQVVPIDADPAAELVLVTLLVEEAPEEGLTRLRHILEDPADPLALVADDEAGLDAGRRIGLLGGAFGWNLPRATRLGPVLLEEHVAGDRAHVGAETLGRHQAALLAEAGEHAGEGL